MLSGISILCFSASYTIALVLEASRLMFRSGVRGAMMVGFGAAGFFAHTVFLAYRAADATGLPLSSKFDWYLLAAWLLAGAYLYLTLHWPRTPIGLFLLPLVLALVGVARFFADQKPFPQSEATQFWGMVHGGFLLVGYLAVIVGFVAGLMHLVQSYRLKHKLLPIQGFRLPSLESLERAGAQALVLSALMLGFGFLSGMVLNAIIRARQAPATVPWSDPVVWSFGLFLGWLVTAAIFSLLYKPARQGRKVAYLTVASFLLLVLALGIRLMFSTQHAS